MRRRTWPRLHLLALLSTLPFAPTAALANVPIAIAPGEQSEPAMVSDEAGGAIVVWQDFRNGASSDVYAQRIGPDGTPLWMSGGVAVCTAPAFQTLPRIVSDGAGGAIIAWTDYRNGNGDIYVQRLDPDGTALWTEGGRPVCDDGQPQLGVQLTADGNGGAVAVWEDYRAGSEGDLYAQRVSASGVPAWALNGVVVCAATGTQTAPSVCNSGGANTIVLWRDQRTSGAGDLYAQRLSSSGSRQWAPDGAPVCLANGGQYDPVMVPDGAGGAIAVWSDERDGGEADIYAQRIGTSGIVAWTANGIPVCGAPSYQLFPVAAADGAGGVLVAWEDSRSDTTVNVYAQRVGPDGLPWWEADGLRLADSDGYQSLPAILSDGGGGAIVAWQDQRDMDDDVYAQRVSGPGIRMWPTAGLPVATATDAQISPALSGDGDGGALFTWYDARNGDWDVYAQHADAWGLMGPTADVLPSPSATGLVLAAPAPNPARGPFLVRFALPVAASAELALFDAAGRRVATLVDGPLEAGVHALAFDTAACGAARPGLYFVRLTALGRTAVTRLVTRP